MEENKMKDTRKEEILESARILFSRHGYYDTKIDEIIKHAQVGKGTFYRFYHNKDDLFVTLLSMFLDLWEKEVLLQAESGKKAGSGEYFHELILRSFYFFKEHEDLCNIYFRAGPGANTLFEPFIEKFENRMLECIMVELREGREQGFLRKNFDMEMASNMIAGAFLRVDYYYFVLKKKHINSLDLGAMANEFYSIALRGILK